MTEFLTIGEALVVLASQDLDLSLAQAQHFTKYLAGAELNVAIGMSRLGHSASYITKVGCDPLGQFIVNSLADAGISLSNLTEDKNFQTGFYLKQKVSQGDPEIAYFRKNSAAAHLTEHKINSVKFDSTKIAHLTGIFPALSKISLAAFRKLNQTLNEQDILTVFDPNLRPSLWQNTACMIHTLNELAQHSQIVLPGINEGEILTGSRNPNDIADFYLKQSALTHTVIVKLGASGVFVKLKSGKKFSIPSFKVGRVIDTVGAGDGFAVGLESALLEDKPLEVALRRACAIGALAVQSPGDNDGYPTRTQLQEFYQEHHYEGDL